MYYLGQLPLVVLKGWLYIESVQCGTVVQYPWSSTPGAPGVILHGLCAPSCCGWAVTVVGILCMGLASGLAAIAEDILVVWVGPQPG